LFGVSRPANLGAVYQQSRMRLIYHLLIFYSLLFMRGRAKSRLKCRSLATSQTWS